MDVKHYRKIFFNEETGKERYGLIQKEAENVYKNNSIEKCWDIAKEIIQVHKLAMKLSKNHGQIQR